MEKTVVALLTAALAIVGTFIVIDPSLQEAITVFAVAAVGVYSVFAIPNPGPDDVYKALVALVAAAGSLVAFANLADPSTIETIVASVISVIGVITVHQKANTA